MINDDFDIFEEFEVFGEFVVFGQGFVLGYLNNLEWICECFIEVMFVDGSW